MDSALDFWPFENRLGLVSVLFACWCHRVEVRLPVRSTESRCVQAEHDILREPIIVNQGLSLVCQHYKWVCKLSPMWTVVLYCYASGGLCLVVARGDELLLLFLSWVLETCFWCTAPVSYALHLPFRITLPNFFLFFFIYFFKRGPHSIVRRFNSLKD